MKKAHSILSHLSSLPQFKLLKPQGCYQNYIKLLKPKWQKGIAFIYIKEETLFIAVTHPVFKVELNYNKDSLIDLLKMLNTYDLDCKMMIANKVVVFHSKYHPVTQTKIDVLTVPYYQEQALGRFESPKDTKLQEAFERIKNVIQCKE
ncbi:MAG: hypothetical protein Q9M36_07080 [Sulfurovum sp.]|nr:hypothetical protein [Sulfurovum sp.]